MQNKYWSLFHIEMNANDPAPCYFILNEYSWIQGQLWILNYIPHPFSLDISKLTHSILNSNFHITLYFSLSQLFVDLTLYFISYDNRSLIKKVRKISIVLSVKVRTIKFKKQTFLSILSLGICEQCDEIQLKLLLFIVIIGFYLVNLCRCLQNKQFFENWIREHLI